MSNRGAAGPFDASLLLVFPYNGNALEALDCVGDSYRFIGFVDDTPEKQGIERHGSPKLASLLFPVARNPTWIGGASSKDWPSTSIVSPA
jgi:hypothetical protein